MPVKLPKCVCNLASKIVSWQIYIPPWSSFYAISQSRVIRSSYFWFIFVPIAARLLSKFPQDVMVSLPGDDDTLRVHIGLPFTWQLFFFGATLMAIANAIFMVRCPEIIRKYKDFSMFQTEGRSTEQLRDLYLRW